MSEAELKVRPFRRVTRPNTSTAEAVDLERSLGGNAAKVPHSARWTPSSACPTAQLAGITPSQ